MCRKHCAACDDLFTPRRTVPNQRFCSKPECQRERRPPLSPISFPLSIANNLLVAQISICTFCVAQLTQAVIETSTQGMDAAQHRTCEVAHGVGGKLAPGAGCKSHNRRCQLWLQNYRIEGLCKVLSHSVAC